MANTAQTPSQNAQNVVKLFQGEPLDFNVTGGNTAITTAGVTVVKAANADLRYYVTGFEFFNNSATIATVFNILDGATVIWVGNLPAVTGQIIVELTTPIRGSINTALNIQAVTTLANVYWNVKGYLGV